MKLGIDISSYPELMDKNPVYIHNGERIEPISYLHDHNGVDLMRLRVWNNPYDEEGHSYHGGAMDLKTLLVVGKLAACKGYSLFIDIQYSDFWCDPGKQNLPKQWRNYNQGQVIQAVYDYTREVLEACKKESIPVSAVQLGNEITNGMLWPFGQITWDEVNKKRGNYEGLCALLRAGINACKDVDPAIKTAIHLEGSGNKELHQEYFDNLFLNGIDDFDIIALSYYPYYHGSFEQLCANVRNLKSRFHKEIWIVETSYGFTFDDAIVDGKRLYNVINEKFFEANPNYLRPYPFSKQGQVDFILKMFEICKNKGITAMFYWEPLLLPLPGVQWASVEGQNYIKESKQTENDWMNQCLFDYEGVATPAFDIFKI